MAKTIKLVHPDGEWVEVDCTEIVISDDEANRIDEYFVSDRPVHQILTDLIDKKRPWNEANKQ